MLRLAHDDGGGNGVAEWVEVAGCDDCGECGTQAVLATGPLAPGEYLLVVEGFSTAEGDYLVTMACHDVCGDALRALGGRCDGAIACGATVAGDTDDGAHGSALGNDAGDAFYFFELEADVDGVTFDSCASAFDTWLRVLRLSPEVRRSTQQQNGVRRSRSVALVITTTREGTVFRRHVALRGVCCGSPPGLWRVGSNGRVVASGDWRSELSTRVDVTHVPPPSWTTTTTAAAVAARRTAPTTTARRRRRRRPRRRRWTTSPASSRSRAATTAATVATVPCSRRGRCRPVRTSC